MYREIKYGSYKKEIVNLIRKRLKLKDKMRYRQIKIDEYKADILRIKNIEIKELEDDLELLMKKAGN